MIINGPTVGTPMPRTNYEQTDSSKADYLKGKEALDKKIDDAKTAAMNAAGTAQNTANTALAKANEAQPKLGFVPVQQGFMDGTGNSKVRLGWKSLDDRFGALGIEVDGTFVGHIVVDSANFGGIAPITSGGTGAKNASEARINLGVPEELLTMTITPIGAHDCNAIYSAGLTLIRSGENIPSPDPYGSLLTMPYTAPKGNTKPAFAGQIFIPNGDMSTKANTMYFRTSLAESWNPWREVMTTVLGDHLYGKNLPSSGMETGQVYYLEG